MVQGHDKEDQAHLTLPMSNIKHNLETIKHRIREYEQKYQRTPGSVSLLAVSKKQSPEKIQSAIAAGQTAFGESYLQESLEKKAILNDPNIEWHFIGPIQSNKTKKIAEHFAWVHSVDSIRIAERLNNQRPETLPPLNICIEVNVDNEKTKSGAGPENIHSIIDYCLHLPRVKLRGLMTIPAPKSTFIEQRKSFHELAKLFNQLREKGILLDTLSMGMSDDYEAAIAEGATIVRIGTAIFGARI